MPRKRNQPVAELVEAQAQLATGGIPESHPPLADEAYPHTSDHAEATPATQEQTASERGAEPDTSFDTAAFDKKPEPKRLASIADDRRNGIRIEHETSRQPGQVFPRVFIRFSDDKRPSVDEKKMLIAEGFIYNLQEKAWFAPKGAVSILLAKRCVNEITKGRGDEGAQLYV